MKLPEVPLVPRGYIQTVNPRRRCNHRVFNQLRRLPTISRAHSRKHAESMGNAVNEASTIVSHASISRALAASSVRVNSTPACSG
jgi:hypothetical protein